MIVGGQTEARALTIVDYHEPFDQGFTYGNAFDLQENEPVFGTRVHKYCFERKVSSSHKGKRQLRITMFCGNGQTTLLEFVSRSFQKPHQKCSDDMQDTLRTRQ